MKGLGRWCLKTWMRGCNGAGGGAEHFERRHHALQKPVVGQDSTAESREGSSTQ